MASLTGTTPSIVKVATVLSKVHVAFKLTADDLGYATITTRNQATLDAAVEASKR